jgi:hypothetical protein
MLIYTVFSPISYKVYSSLACPLRAIRGQLPGGGRKNYVLGQRLARLRRFAIKESDSQELSYETV